MGLASPLSENGGSFITCDDVQDLLESHAESLSNELIELNKALQEVEKREMRKKNLCMAWTSKLLKNVLEVPKTPWKS